MGWHGLFQRFDWYRNHYKTLYGNKEGYYRKFVDLISPEDMLSMTIIDDDRIIPSNEQIKVFGISFHDKTTQLIKRMGKPRYHSSDLFLGLEHAIYFYKRTFFGHRAVVQFHFLNDVLFYCSISFFGLSQKYEIWLHSLLDEKYAAGKGESQFKVFMDRNRDLVWFEKSVFPRIVYCNNSDSIKMTISGKIERQKRISQKDQQNHYAEWRSNL